MSGVRSEQSGFITPSSLSVIVTVLASLAALAYFWFPGHYSRSPGVWVRDIVIFLVGSYVGLMAVCLALIFIGEAIYAREEASEQEPPAAPPLPSPQAADPGGNPPV